MHTMRIARSSTIMQIVIFLSAFLISLSFRNDDDANKSYLAPTRTVRRGTVPRSDEIAERSEEAQFSASSREGATTAAGAASPSAPSLRSSSAAPAALTDAEIFAMRKAPPTIFGSSKCGGDIFRKRHPGCRRLPHQQDPERPTVPLAAPPPRSPPPTSIDESPATTSPSAASPIATRIPTVSPIALAERSFNCVGASPSSDATMVIPTDIDFFRGDVFCWTANSGGSSYFGSTWSRQFGLFANGEAVWEIPPSAAASLFSWKFQDDGNLVARNTAGETLWASGTHGHFGASLIVSKGRIWIETNGGQEIWSLPDHPPPLFHGDGPDLSAALQYYAYYYPWYYRNDWSRHGYQDTPLLGLYGTDEVAVAEQHIEWALQAGITSWVISYWGSDSLSMRHFKTGMINAPSLSKIKFCMLYETPILDGRGNWYDGSKEEALYQDLKVIRDNFFSHQSYLRIDGRPVIVLYITRSRMRWQEGFSPSVITNMRERLGHDIYFIADEPFFNSFNERPEGNGNAIVNGRQVFDAYTTYNMYEDSRVQDGEMATAYQLREALPIWQNWASEVPFFPNVMPQYYDFRGHKPLLGNSTDFMTQLRETACLPRTKFDGAPHAMFITSFNEWWEGTQIEPENGSSENWNNYGFQFIETLASFKKTVDENGTYWCPNARRSRKTRERI